MSKKMNWAVDRAVYVTMYLAVNRAVDGAVFGAVYWAVGEDPACSGLQDFLREVGVEV
jgi:hypothetical protein